MDPFTLSLIGQAGYGLYQAVSGSGKLKKLGKEPKARYMDAASGIQENKALGEQMYKTGMTGSAEAVADQAAAAQTAGMTRQATELSGGQLSSAIGRIGASNLYQLGLGKANLEQAAKERGMGIMMGANRELSALQRADVGQDISYRERTETALGTAIQQGGMNMLGALGGYAQGKQYQDYLDYLKGAGTSAASVAAPAAPAPEATATPSYEDMVSRIGKMPAALGLPATAKEGDTAMSGGKLFVYRGGKWEKMSS